MMGNFEKEYKKLPWLAKVLSLKKWGNWMYLRGQISVMEDTIERTK